MSSAWEAWGQVDVWKCRHILRLENKRVHGFLLSRKCMLLHLMILSPKILMSMIAHMRAATENQHKCNISALPNDGWAAVFIGADEHQQCLAAAVDTDVDIPCYRTTWRYTWPGLRSWAAPRWRPTAEQTPKVFSEMCMSRYIPLHIAIL